MEIIINAIQEKTEGNVDTVIEAFQRRMEAMIKTGREQMRAEIRSGQTGESQNGS